ncbi:MBOAT family O-acyltransferase [Pseudomonas sp. BGr12]|uniref:MBOAT family O-acyltransferase n=1 Tax=unclassified Pseudomonas TaxID=196821 RepID=UPI00177C9CCE|nr:MULTISPECIES: MBOAT family O-acyltransferase [unclassified Pseudomonas]MBD9501685.1 MBOAT family protein [Pseudomonas sp. PDM17]MDL2427302.1 MBOAT family protein [Pseudomonas sp. BJa5]
MVFSSPAFLFVFFPVFFILYSLLPRPTRNSFILLASVLFYVCGAGALTFVALIMLVANWLLAQVLGNLRGNPSSGKLSSVVFTLCVLANLGPLLFYKYLIFFIHVFHDLTGASWFANVETWKILLPLGISFYTFHFISYITDVYTGHIRPEKSLQKFAIYIFLFPHLIAGPVVRFSEVKQQLDVKRRKLVSSDIFWGMAIFVIGLSKKILIADPLGAVVDSVHAPGVVVTTYSAWLSAFCYSFQIYFDFSGYTDMAIGMARMLGFRFPRNFNRPYAAHTVTEFWRRWHMTLSRWFRDYVYIPLGGNRASSFGTYRNLFIVFGLCALWHGAAYTFLIWGVGHGSLIALERAGVLKPEKYRLGSVPVFLFATLLWVPFRAADMGQTTTLWKAMFGLSSQAPAWVPENLALADFKVIFLLALATVICLVSDKRFYKMRAASFRKPGLVAIYCVLLYVLSCISVVERGFHPFIYFQF